MKNIRLLIMMQLAVLGCMPFLSGQTVKPTRPETGRRIVNTG